MFRAELLEVINSGEAWAFVGSGASADAGCPSWPGLVDTVAKAITPGKGFSDRVFDERREAGNYPGCFTRIEELADRAILESSVRHALAHLPDGKPIRPGRFHRLLSELPFAGYITTNYDMLLETALERESGWISAGNTANEVRKVGGGATKVVWHIHGALELPDSQSRLILTTADYDDLYAEDAPVVRQLRGLVGHRQCVFLGFGLEDPDINELLRRVGRLANPARRIFAILPDSGRYAQLSERQDLLHRFNVDVITYPVRDGSYDAGIDLIELYGSLTLRRSIQYGRPLPPRRSYDPETTGLLVYNELVLREGLAVADDIRHSLVLAWLLTYLSSQESPRTDVDDAFAALVSQLAAQVGGTAAGEPSGIDAAVADAIERGWVAEEAGRLALTVVGRDQVLERSARAESMSQRFDSAVRARALKATTSADAAALVAEVAVAYFNNCVERRSLGVARATQPGRFSDHEYHAVALLQSLGEFIPRVGDETQARALVLVVTGVLSEPTPDEAGYIGTSVQARFGMHLLGYDEDTLRVRAREFEHTVFLVDSNTLIPLLARSSLAYAEAVDLIERLRSLNCPLLTMPLLSEEVVEHAQYAQDAVGRGEVDLSEAALEIASGHADARSNAFLEGLLVEIARGDATPNISKYLAEVLSLPANFRRVTDHRSEVAGTLSDQGIRTVRLEALEGYADSTKQIVDSAATRLALRRGSTYRHPRQVHAEAQAQVLVLGLRRGDLRIPDLEVSNAYFVSSTGIIDEEAGERITMRRDAALLWLSTLRAYKPEDAAAIYGGLLWELQERGLDLVSHDVLRRAFRPLLVASKEQLGEELARHRELIEAQYGPGSAESIENATILTAPMVLVSHQAQRAEYLANRLAERDSQVAELTERLAAAEQANERSEKKAKGREKYERRIGRRGGKRK